VHFLVCAEIDFESFHLEKGSGGVCDALPLLAQSGLFPRRGT
jgi:hypothetical protein